MRTDWKHADVVRALGAIKRKNRCDATGSCVAMWWQLFQVQPDTVVKYFGWLAAQSDRASNTTILCRALGKKAAKTKCKDLRIICPLPVEMQVLDYLLAWSLAEVLHPLDVRTHGWQVCGVKHTQPLDVAFGFGQLVEKGLLVLVTTHLPTHR